MINKFLFDVDEKGKKVLYGLIEDEDDGLIELGSEIDYLFKGDYDESEISRNLGGQCYVVFDDNGTKKYLDIDFYKEKAKINLTEKIAYAFPLSEDLVDIVLDYLNVDIDYEVIYGCFYEHPKKGTVDILERQFKGLFTDSFVQVIKEGVSYFLGQNEGYFLTRNLREAKKFHKSEVRKILIINKFIDKTTELKQLYFSPYQLLRGTEEFFLLNPSPLMVSKVEDDFIIKTSDIRITNGHLLCKSELINGKMKEIHGLLNKEQELEKGYGLCYSKYLEVSEDKFTLNSNPSKMSLVSKSSISLFSSIYSMFSETEVTFLKEQNLTYVYELEENLFRLSSTNINDYVDTNVVKESVYYDYLKHFISKSMVSLDKGIVLSSDNKYLSVEILDNNDFKLKYNDSSYEATVFTPEQADILKKILKIDITKRELNNILKNLDKYNISKENKTFNIESEYKSILNEIVNKKYKLDIYNDGKIKLESEKGSLEYLRKFYFKAIKDSEILFTNILNANKDLKNILLVESLVNLDLIALNNVATKLNRNVEVSLITTSKMGYFGKVSLSNNVKFNEVYRMNFCAMPKVFLNKFDLILFSRGFAEQDKTFDHVIKNIIESQNVILANVKHCNLDKSVDSFAVLFDKIKRKHFMDYENSNKIVDECRLRLETAGLSGHNGIYVTDPIVEKQFSYHSIVIVKDKKVFDFYK
ncbi:MAG: hypothetical protein R3Y60_04705 [bacterium]